MCHNRVHVCQIACACAEMTGIPCIRCSLELGSRTVHKVVDGYYLLSNRVPHVLVVVCTTEHGSPSLTEALTALWRSACLHDQGCLDLQEGEESTGEA